jgi:predicted dienelactone hydrolase
MRLFLENLFLTSTISIVLNLIARVGTAEARLLQPASTASIPDNPAGRQLRWFLEATKSLPIPAPAVEEHFSDDYLAIWPPEILNLVLALPSFPYTTMVYLDVVSMTDVSIDAKVDPGNGGSPRIFSLTVDANGLIVDFVFKFLTLPPRADRGLAPVSLPKPTGRFLVGTETLVATDAARAGRRIPVQLWYPADRKSARESSPARYALPATSAFLAEHLAVPVQDVTAIRTNAFAGPKVLRRTGGRQLPIVLFSPGCGLPRVVFSGLAADLASHGYLVAVLEHPGEVQAVEFPDGSIVDSGIEACDDVATLAGVVPTRVADIGAARDLLARLDAEAGGRMHNALDLSRIAVAGHSLGGAAAAEAMYLDREGAILAGISLDGPFFGEVGENGLDDPFLLVLSDNEGVELSPSIVSFRALSTQETTLEIAGAAHLNFSDIPALFAFRAPDDPREILDIGPIDIERSAQVQSAYVRAFLDHHLSKNKPPQPLLDGLSRQYPEVNFVV